MTSELFSALEVAPLAGRWFDVAETRPDGPAVAILSCDVWRSACGGDRGVVGWAIEVNGVMRTIVGIMPPGFDVMARRIEVWLPLVVNPGARRSVRTA